MDTGQYFQAMGVRFSSCTVQFGLCFCCSAHNRLTSMPGACGGREGSCAKKTRFIMLLCAIFTVLSSLEGQNQSLHFYSSEDSWDCPTLLVSINK